MPKETKPNKINVFKWIILITICTLLSLEVNLFLSQLGIIREYHISNIRVFLNIVGSFLFIQCLCVRHNNISKWLHK
ncbi:hypothetical protein BDD43_2820 [Mucilaginibacter gracilis]|uniref:Uncharacterized protein n=1 Tax=Mucilaginibacter gracilis TaxID=423350 RepID=A0A495J0X3_9SPHI|nr:hypothetical protein BDD43_2820 [Mucilaginibacter gracilis]